MKRTQIKRDPALFPEIFRPLIASAPIYDSSCSVAAEVIFIDCDGGYYLKSAEKGTLQKEAELTRYFHSKGLAAEVLAYESGEKDWLMTRRVNGEDGTHKDHISDPCRLTDAFAEALRSLHEESAVFCPVPNRTKDYLAFAEHNYSAGVYDLSLFHTDCPVAAEFRFATATEAWQTLEKNAKYLHTDTLIHGDYCLPNIMFEDFRFSGFIDLGNGGVADRHIDIFWAIWTLIYNLKSDKYTSRFLDAYGKDKLERDTLRVIAAAEVFG